MKREIIFDTETTGFYPDEGDRITEIGCVEVIDLIATGRELRRLVNPEREVPAEAAAITGHTWEKLKDEPKFEGVADAFLEFVGDSPLVAHNARFDMGFINMELERCGRTPIAPARFVDTAAMAREKFPGAPASLDALCKRFDISLDSRTKHGALIDAYLLAEVYLELNGGRAKALDFMAASDSSAAVVYPERSARPRPLAPLSSPEERARHAAFISSLDGETIWRSAGLLKDEAS
ncbi:MAG: DNA polymerase III subunit epsilon [Pseudomonadota bacterium]